MKSTNTTTSESKPQRWTAKDERMKIAKTRRELREDLVNARKRLRAVGFYPTEYAKGRLGSRASLRQSTLEYLNTMDNTLDLFSVLLVALALSKDGNYYERSKNRRTEAQTPAIVGSTQSQRIESLVMRAAALPKSKFALFQYYVNALTAKSKGKATKKQLKFIKQADTDMVTAGY